MSDQAGNTGGLPLRPDLQKLVERLAARVHQEWMKQRQAEGWKWGPAHDAANKEHPCLVPYAQLPEHEKDVDRRTARTAIQGLLDLGFEIRPPEHKDSEITMQAGAFAPLAEELAAAGTIGLGRLRAIWQICRGQPECPPEIHRALGERMLQQGEAILAYDVLSQGLTAAERGGPAEVGLRIRQLLALALAQSGAPERAGEILTKLQDEGFATPETLGLYGRVCKDLASQAGTIAERTAWLQRSYQSYAAGFDKAEAALHARGHKADRSDAIYCGINAAAVAVLAGQFAEARTRAERVRTICRAALQQAQAAGTHADYWTVATLAEAELIGGNRSGAETAYRQALQLAEGNWRELSSTRRQARLLAPPLGLEAGFVEGLFPPLGIAVSIPPAGAPSGDGQPAAEMRAALDAKGIVAGYATACSPSDLPFIEAMLETGREIHVILPGPRADCRAFFPGPSWERLERMLSKVHAVTEDTQLGCMNEGVNMEFARLRALGAGMLRAQSLDGELHVWGQAAGGPAPTGGTGAAAPAAQGIQESYDIRAMLFGDVKGYSKLSDVELLEFTRQYEGRVAEVLARFPGGILSRRTAGDGIFLVFADLQVAAEVALALRDMVAGTRWDECGLPAHLGIRIALDAGPVYGYRDPITERPDVCGAYVNRAARIEPITPPNQVYASAAFAALHVATCREPLRFEYVGQTQLPKGFGWAPLYGCQPGRKVQTC